MSELVTPIIHKINNILKHVNLKRCSMVNLDKLKSILNSSKLKELGGNKIALYLVVFCVTIISVAFYNYNTKDAELKRSSWKTMIRF